jgi:hypothetical protein
MIALVWTLAGIEDGLNWLSEHPWVLLAMPAVLGVVWLAGRESE